MNENQYILTWQDASSNDPKSVRNHSESEINFNLLVGYLGNISTRNSLGTIMPLLDLNADLSWRNAKMIRVKKETLLIKTV